MNAPLVKYEAAKRALHEARTVDEVQVIRDRSAMQRAYAKQAKDRGLEIDAVEIRTRAERKLGELIKAQKETIGLNKGGWTEKQVQSCGTLEEPQDRPPTLAEAGIDKKLSSRAQQLADVAAPDFEMGMTEWRERTEAGEEPVRLPHVARNSGQNEWYTPPHIIEAARTVMGGIDFDPASTEIANRTVRATVFLTAEDDGRVQPWHGRVWMNPPYAQPLIGEFAEAIATNFETKKIEQACALVNNATETAWFRRILNASAAVCFLSGRVKFLDAEGNASGAPLQGQAVLYMGSRANAFHANFMKMGAVLTHAVT